MGIGCWLAVFCGSHSRSDFCCKGLASSNNRIRRLGGSLAMSTEALRVPSLVLAVMFRAFGRFISPIMALCGSMMRFVMLVDSQWYRRAVWSCGFMPCWITAHFLFSVMRKAWW